MTKINSVIDALAEINKIQSSYCLAETTEEQLIKWINNCVRLSIVDEPERKETFKYSGCRIQYLKKLTLFSLVKTKTDCDGYPTGVSYDIGIAVQPYLVMFFGTDRLPVLKQAVQLLDEDLEEISQKIFEDISAWCRNVDSVCNQLSLAI